MCPNGQVVDEAKKGETAPADAAQDADTKAFEEATAGDPDAESTAREGGGDGVQAPGSGDAKAEGSEPDAQPTAGAEPGSGPPVDREELALAKRTLAYNRVPESVVGKLTDEEIVVMAAEARKGHLGSERRLQKATKEIARLRKELKRGSAAQDGEDPEQAEDEGAESQDAEGVTDEALDDSVEGEEERAADPQANAPGVDKRLLAAHMELAFRDLAEKYPGLKDPKGADRAAVMAKLASWDRRGEILHDYDRESVLADVRIASELVLEQAARARQEQGNKNRAALASQMTPPRDNRPIPANLSADQVDDLAFKAATEYQDPAASERRFKELARGTAVKSR